MTRVALLAIAALALPGPIAAEPLAYRGFTVTFDAGVSEKRQRELAASLRCQIDIVDTVALSPDILARLRQVPFTVTSAGGSTPGHYVRGQGVALKPTDLSSKTPVLLHELLHAYHIEMMPPGKRQQLMGFFGRARTAKLFPAQSYMLTNDREFFAMTASTLLNGRIQRDPYTRTALKAAMPVYYQWLLNLFGLTEDQLVPVREADCS